jgi:penicillin-binding protein
MERSKKKKTSNKPFLIIGLLVALLVLAGGGYYAYNQWQEKQELAAATKAGKDFINTLSDQKFEALPKLVNETSLKNNKYNQDSLVKKYQAIFSGIQAQEIKSSDVKVTKDKDDQFSLTYKLSMSTPLGTLKDLNYQTTIVKKGDRYQVNWAPALIFPDMSGNDKIAMQVDSAQRGEIVDRNGNGLAINKDFDEVGMVPGKLGEGAERTANIQAFSDQFKISVDEINKKLAQSWVQFDSFVPITVSYEPVTSLPPGAATKVTKLRYYPLGEAAAQLIGYTGTVTAEDIEKNPSLSTTGIVGKAGLERAFDKELRGQDGGSLLITDENNNVKKELQKIAKQDGKTIKTTIDSQAQQQAFAIFAGRSGSVVVTKPQSGDLLATVSSPSYDPNKMANGISQAEYDTYNKNEQLPFTARFATGYAPGSTFKTITGAIGLDAGTLKPEEALEIQGLKWQKNASWGNYFVTRVKEANPVNLRTALVNSDNIYFAQQTLRMGEDTFRKGLDKFIFGEELDLPIAMNPAQISNEDKFNSEILLADTGYGQGQLLITPIQQATIYSVFQNEGNLVYPKLILDKKTKTKEAVVSKDAANTIVTDLLGSVEDEAGYVHNMYNPNFSLAAKTGTAEIKDKQDTDGKENSFLLAMDRSNNQFLTIVMVEDSGKSVADTATNISKPLIDYLETTYQ